MKDFFKRYDIPRKLLSILLALALWVIVVSSSSSQRPQTYSGVSAIFVGADQLETDYGLKIIEGIDQKFTIKVSSTFDTMSKFNSTRSRVSVNLAALNITEPGTYTIHTDSDCQVNVYNARITNTEILYPSSFQIVVDSISSKEVPVTVEVEGLPSADYMYDAVEANQDTVTVSGPASVVAKIKKAVAIVPAADSSHLTKTANLLVSCTFLDENGEIVDPVYLTSTPSELPVKIPVYRVAKIPLTVDLIESGSLTKDSVDVTIEPAEISVYGAEEIVSRLTEVKLGSINLRAVDLTEPKTMPITLPSSVNRMVGEPGTAKVTIKAAGMSTREITVNEIELQNDGTDPNLRVNLTTPSVIVRLQAESGTLGAVTAEDIKVRAVFNADSLGVGTHEVEVEVQPYGIANFTVLNVEPSKVTIEITQQDEAPTEEEPAQ